jgi:hypothetical protein
MPLDPKDYARISALAFHAVLIRSIEASYPTLPMRAQDAILVDILGRVALMRGCEVRRLIYEEADGE